MAYFVTGATGFIGRFLVANLLKRGEPIYVLVRKGSEKKLAALRDDYWGATDKQVIGVVGDLGKHEPRRRRRRPARSSRARSSTSSISPRSTTSRRAPRRSRPPTSRARATRCEFAAGRRRRLLPSRELDRRGRPLRRRVPRGHVRGGRGPRPSVLQDQARFRRHRAQASASGRSASTGPGFVVGDSKTGYIDKIDGPYYFFKSLQKLRDALPPWMPMIGIEGGRINIVPVDFVADALDYLAHKKGLDGKCFHLTDPAPHRIGEVLNIFAKAGHAPQMTMRVNARMFGFIPAPILYGLGSLAPIKRMIRAVLTDLGIPQGRVPVHQLADALRQPRGGEGAQGLRHRGAARSRPTRRSCGTTGSATSTRISSSTARSSGRVKDKVVVVTGSSSGIGKATALKLAEAGAKVILVARGEEKLARDEAGDRQARAASAWIYTADISDLASCDALVARVLKEHGALRLSSSTTPAARSAAASSTRSTASTISSGRCSSTISARCGSSWASCRR